MVVQLGPKESPNRAADGQRQLASGIRVAGHVDKYSSEDIK